MIRIIIIMLFAFSLVGCFLFDEKQNQTKKSALGERNIQYYSNKTVTSLEVPPDLTKPDSQNAFKLSEYVANIPEDTISFSKDGVVNKKAASVVSGSANVKVKRTGQIRWLVVDKKPDAVWDLAKSFLKSHNFAIQRSDKKIGIMETDFLENYPEIPDQSLGLIRSFLAKAVKTRYTLPIIDKYRIRIESIENGNKTEVYFTLSSMEEVITDKGGEEENTIWQARPKDQSLETEMLYRFMVYLGSDHAIARAQITNAKEQQTTKVEIMKGIGGYTKLRFALSKHETWENIAWALDELNIDIEDRDVKEGSFYVSADSDKNQGILSRLFGNHAIKQSYQIIVKQINNNTSEVTFNDLSENNQQETIELSHQLLGDIAKKFQ